MAIDRESLLDEAMECQKQIMRAIHMSQEPIWLALDLTMAQLKSLVVLADNHMTIGQLADLLRIGKPASSILVDRLVQLKLVERIEDPEDRRRTIVRLTAQGEGLVMQLRQGGQERLRTLLAGLDDDDLAALVRGLRGLVKVTSGDSKPVHA